MSGHNKWSKIKHKKTATDSERSKLFSKHALSITMESKQAGGDVESPALSAAILRAKKDSMPKENIERAILKGTGTQGSQFSKVLFETFGPAGTAILITAITNNNNRTSQEIKHLLVKNGYVLGAPGSAAWAFAKESEGSFTPLSTTVITSEQLKELEELLLTLEDHADVEKIVTNAENL